MQRTTTISTALLALLLTGVSQAQPSGRGTPSGSTTLTRPAPPPTYVRDDSKSSTSDVSGYTAAALARRVEVFQFPLAGDAHNEWQAHGVSLNQLGLTGITISERGDRPRYAFARFRSFRGDKFASFPRESSHTSNNATGFYRTTALPPTTSRPVLPNELGQTRSVSVAHDMFVYGVQVCTTNHNQIPKRRLKGVRLYGASFDASNGTFTRSQTPFGYELPNCPNNGWRNRVDCEDGRIATGLVYHVGTDDQFRGIALRCSAVKPE